MAETRQLAAILAADIAGYSKLASADKRTLARLRAFRSDLTHPTIAPDPGAGSGRKPHGPFNTDKVTGIFAPAVWARPMKIVTHRIP